MEFTLQRETPTVHSTPGTMSGFDVPIYSLEPPPVPDPAYDQCPVSIPAGRYRLTMQPSAEFSRILGCAVSVPVYQGIPGRPPYHPESFTAVEIHFGNTVEEPGSTELHPVFLTLACTLAGLTRVSLDEIGDTREACINHIWPQIAEAETRGEEVWITVIDAVISTV